MRSRGMQGEEIACGYLEASGYTVLQRNYTVRYGEIDIIAQDGDTLVFAEVKQRTTNRYASGREAVDANKQSALRTAARFYMAQHNLFDKKVRFDVVELSGPTAFPEIEIIKNAF